MPTRLRAVVSGWYGAPNVGDELLLATLKTYATRARVDLVAISVDPALTRAMHGIEAVEFHNLGAIAHAMLDADLFIMGGGGIFQDHHGFHVEALYDPLALDMATYARPFFLARQLGLRTVIWGHGVGPLASDAARTIARSVFAQADHVSVRDEASAELLREIGVDRTLVVGPDPAWLGMTMAGCLDRPREPGKKTLALIIREWPYDTRWYDSLVQSLLTLAGDSWRCTLLAFQPRQISHRTVSDLPVMERLRADLGGTLECTVVGEGDPKRALPYLCAADAVLSMRLHGTMMALNCGKPTGVIEYDAKLGQLDDMVGLGPVWRVHLDSPASAYTAMLRALTDVSAKCPMSPQALRRMQVGAQVHARLLEQAFAAQREQGRRARDWAPGDGLNWLAAWLEQAVAANTILVQQNADGLQLLKFRDDQLARLEPQVQEGTQAKAVVERQDTLMEMLRTRLQDFEVRLRDAEARLQGAEADLRSAKTRAQDSETRLRNAEARLQGTEADLRSAETRAQDSEIRQRDAEARLQGTEADLRSAKTRAHDSETRLRDAEARLQGTEADLRSAKTRAQDSETRLRDAETRLQDTETGLQAGQAILADKEIYIAQLRLALDEARRGLWPRCGAFMRRLGGVPARVWKVARILRVSGISGLRKALRDRRQPLCGGLDSGGDPTVAAPTAPAGTSRNDFAELFEQELILFSPRPFGPGVAHRHAQLAEAALATGRRVAYFHVGAQGPASTKPGMVVIPTDGLRAVDLLEWVSPHASVVVACATPEVVECIRLARVQGARVTVDAAIESAREPHAKDDSWTQLLAMADRYTAATTEIATAMIAAGAHDVEVLPNAASHIHFDVYKDHACPEGMLAAEGGGLAAGRVVAIYMPMGTQAIDWSLVERLCAVRPGDRMHVVGAGSGPARPADNLVLHGHLPTTAAAAFLSAADLVVLPCTPVARIDPQNGLGAYAGIFMRKPVVTNVDFSIPSTSLLTVCADGTNFIAACVQRLEQPLNDVDVDDFVMANSWLARLEQLLDEGGRHNVSVIILIHNNAPIIGRCLRSMLMHARPWLAEIIVVDNASSDGGAEYVEREFPGVRVLRNPQNGCSSGRNLGARHATGKYIAFFDSDQWLVGGTGFGEALAVLERHAAVGAIGWNAGWFDAVRDDLSGPIADYIPHRAMNAVAVRDGYRTDIGFLGTSGMFLRRSLFEALDGFDTFYDPTCFEDTDLCFQIKQYGLQVAFRDLSGIRHQPHQTTGANTGSAYYSKLFERNARYFRRKWRAHPEFFVDYES